MKTLNHDNAYKYNNLISELRRQIFTGKLKEGDRLPSERKLSDIFGYSRVTIRIALQQLKNERLVEQIQGKGTFVRAWQHSQEESGINNGTRQLKIGCLCYRPAGISIDLDPYYNQIFLGLHRTKHQNITYDLQPIEFTEQAYLIKAIKQHRNDYDGFLIVNNMLEDMDVRFLEEEQINYIALGKADSLRSYSYVDIDNFVGLYDCAEHLIQRDRKKILLLINSRISPLDQDRINGYKTALTDNGLSIDEDLIKLVHIRDKDDNMRVISQLLEERDKFDGIIAFGDWTNFWLISALRDAGANVPDDVAVIGYSVFSWIFYGLKMKLTNLVQPFPEMAERALLMLTDRCLGLRNDIQISVIKPTLEIGESTPEN